MKDEQAELKFATSNSNLTNDPEVNLEELIETHENSFLNFYAVKQVLIKFDPKDEAQLYKALFALRDVRCRLTKKQYSQNRSIYLYSVIYYDLLGIEKASPFNILEKLLHDSKTLSETLKLLNILANERVSRNYLSKCRNILNYLVKIMYNEEEDNYERQNCLSVIQKFSLKPEAQNEIIDLDVINWIVSIFVSV